jgi:hypothetical protein
MMFVASPMITCREVANAKGLLISCSGDLDAKDLTVQMSSLRQSFPNLDSWYFAVTDLSNVGHLNVTAADFDLLVEQHIKVAQFTRRGLPVGVVARTELAFGISRMWQVASESTGWESQVFRDRGPAESWLRQRVLALYEFEIPPLDWKTEVAATGS